MRTKIVYVLVSTDKDYYLEQAYVSMYSLKKHNPNAHIVVLTDEDTYHNILNNCRREIFASFIDEWKCISFSKDISNKERSRWLKTSLRNILNGDLLFVDTDTIICGDLSEIDKLESELAITLDLHIPLSSHPFRKHIANNILRMYGISIPEGTQYYNSGVIYMKDTDRCKDFFAQWHRNWKAVYTGAYGCFDQQPLIKTVIDLNGYVSDLPGDFNCQVLGSIQYLHTAKIVHFFNTQWCKTILSPLFDKEFYYSIKKNGGMNEDQRYIVDNCKSSIVSPSMPIGVEDMKLWNSSCFKYLRVIMESSIFGKMAYYALKTIYLMDRITNPGGVKSTCDIVFIQPSETERRAA